MPKMNGYQVCRALAESEDLKSVPVVLMSAKGDQVGDRFVKVMGIVDYITKPFSPEALVAVVSHTLEKYPPASVTGEDGPAFEAPDAGYGSEIIDDAEVEEITGARPAELVTGTAPGMRTLEEREEVVPRLSPEGRRIEALRGAIAHAIAADELRGDELAELVRDRLTD